MKKRRKYKAYGILRLALNDVEFDGELVEAYSTKQAALVLAYRTREIKLYSKMNVFELYRAIKRDIKFKEI